MIRLYPYQQALRDKIRAAWAGGVRAVLAVLPTGGGKTVVFSSLMHDHVGASAAVVHRREIVAQISLSLAAVGVKHRVIAPPKTVSTIRKKHLKRFGKSYVDPHAAAGVVSVQTLTSKSSRNDSALRRWLEQVTLAVFDEGHHYVTSGLWANAVEMLGADRMLFVTATPERADGKGLGSHASGFADLMIEGPTMQTLIDGGFLTPFVYKAPKTDLDVKGLAVTASGDFNARALRARVVESHLVGDVVEHYKAHASGQRAIVFASDVATADEIAAAFRAAGVPSAALSGETDAAIRDRELERFESGELLALVNVDLFDEGFDVPAVEAVIMARPTESLAKFLQMVGRALRIMDGKTEATIIDPVRNWERHGMPNWPRDWSLDDRVRGSAGKRSPLIAQRICDDCTQPYEAFFKLCPYCGFEPLPAGRRHPEQVAGDLAELDVEAMAALFAKLRAADLDDDEYAAGQIARGVPSIGRPADLRRHREAKYRRRVLRELVAWWVGMQPTGRDMAEIHRRFFYRFGVDIGTAFTLNARETDGLIACIQQKFTEDMV